ncbi:MAG: basic secretory family protein [Candidatus Bathyarchaeota archaeon]|nr:basic secretory family protein [Candidatus Bathyarchaeota archaeon]
MNQKNVIVVVCAVLIAVLLFSAFEITDLQGDEYVVQAQKIFDDARIKIEQVRNVTLPSHEITLHVITKQKAQDMWGKPSGTQDLTNLYRQEKIYKGLFMMPEKDSLYQATTEWTANWAAATVGKHDIYVIRENFNPFDKTAEGTFIHELLHIWQPELTTPTTYNEDKAHAALIEGDASFMQEYYLNMTETQTGTSHFSVTVPFYLIDNPLFDSVHPMANALWSLNFFPYDQGEIFVDALYQQGGFTTITQAYQAGYTPSSTSQILHPEEYFANTTAKQVQAPTLSEDNWILAKTDRGQDHNTYGEYFIRAMLTTWLDDEVAENAAAGWAGDTFTYYERGESEYLFTWNIQWNSNCDASEFYVAFHNMADAAGAQGEGSCHWSASGERYAMIEWEQATNSTLIAVSNVSDATQEAYFS